MTDSIYLLVGGCRSGKSRWALELAEKLKVGPKLMLATAQAFDDEMKSRIERHKMERSSDWQTWEEPIAIVERIRRIQSPHVILLDCLTLWVSNLILADWSDDAILGEAKELLSALRAGGHQAIIVSNEVGLGLVPSEPLGRRFRDLVGLLHQDFAAEADEVYFTVMGIRLPLKRLAEQLPEGEL